MTIRREWLDWNQPCIPQASAWLIDYAISSNESPSPGTRVSQTVCDLQHTTCILSGQRAGRLLLHELLEQCCQRQLSLVPPQVLTPGSLLSRLTGGQSVATNAESIFTWMSALQQCDAVKINALLSNMPAADDLLTWYELACMLARVHTELAGGDVDFATAADWAERLAMHGEGDRWRALEHVHRQYIAILHECGLRDRHDALHELVSHAGNQPVDTAHAQRLVLIAVAELNATQRKAIATIGSDTIALIHASPDYADHFDEYGCVDAKREGGWKNCLIELDVEPIVAERPDDQARAALACLAAFDGMYSAEEIRIGIGDEAEGVNAMQRAAEWAGVDVHSPIGNPLAHTAPVRFLRAAADWIADPRFANFAALLRHPDVELWLATQLHDEAEHSINEWITLLDTYFSDHLHERLTGHWLGRTERRDRLAAAYRAVQQLLSPLISARHTEQPQSKWGTVILDTLGALYAQRKDVNAISRDACVELRDTLAAWMQIPESLQPRTDAVRAIRLLLLQIEKEQIAIADSLRPDQIEMLGWLELHHDPAPALIITGFNEGCIPHASPGDPFLPDSLRSALGLANRAQRYARDAYLLGAIRRSRKHLSIILGRRSSDGDPMSPSRLLFACDDSVLVQRVRHMCDDKQARQSSEIVIVGAPVSAAATSFEIPALPALPPPLFMRVTDFRKYIDCPYRYALACLLKLEAFCDSASELDPLVFGSLAHNVLCDFGKNEDVRCSNASSEIEKFLLHSLKIRSAETFGDSPMATVRVQIARLQERLKSLALFQAQHRNEGWIIQHCEQSFDAVALDLPDQPPMPLRGKVDRIDRREDEWLIVDYKTNDKATHPHQAHHGGMTLTDEWTDLQLPLYRFLATHGQLGIAESSNVRLGYICLSRNTEAECLHIAEWSEAHIHSAWDKAREIVRNIRAGVFDLNLDYDSSFDSFARICQSTVLRSIDVGDEGGDE